MHSLCKIFNIDPKVLDPFVQSLVTDLVLESHSLDRASFIAENTLTPEIVKNLEKDPEYLKLRKDQLRYAGDLADDTWFRQGNKSDANPDDEFDREFLSDVKGHFEREAEFADAVADFLGKVRLKGFDKETTRLAMDKAGDDYQWMLNAANRLRKDLQKMDPSVYDNSFYSDSAGRKVYDINNKVSRKPGDLVKKVLTKFRDFLGVLGLKHWEYDAFDTKFRHTPLNVRMQQVNQYNPSSAMADHMELKACIDQAVNEGIYEKSAFMAMKEELSLSTEDSKWFDQYVYSLIF